MQEFAHTPDVIREPSRHCRRAGSALVRRFGEFMMCPAQIVGRAEQVYSCLQWAQAANTLTAFARQGGKPLAHDGIQVEGGPGYV